MFCGNCGTKLPDGALFCDNCGARVEGADQEWGYQQDYTNDYEQEIPDDFYDDYDEANVEEKSSKKWIIIAIIALVVLALGIFAAVKLVGGEEKEESKVEEVVEDDTKDDEMEEESDSEEVSEVEEEVLPDAKPTTSMSVVSAPAIDYPILSPERVYATSVVDQPGYDNSAAVMFDGDVATSWQEGAPGNGVGESVSIQFQTEHGIKYIALHLGNWRSEDHYWGNNRPSMLEIKVGDVVSELYFTDEKKIHWIELSEECRASEITITILDVYYGNNTAWNEACISEIEVYGAY